jgi:SAM-dependent methyltransferase
MLNLVMIMTNKKENVYQSYDKMAWWFDEHRSSDLFDKSWLELAIALLPKGAKVLDLGCGMGEPMMPYFIEQGYEVTGIDGSVKLIELARNRFPNAEFIVGDMRKIRLDQKFDLIIAWHSLFHLPQSDQRLMFQSFADHCNDNGVLLFTTGPSAGEIWSDNGGESLYHASLSPADYKKLLASYGFELINHKIEDEDCGGASLWLARYKAE